MSDSDSIALSVVGDTYKPTTGAYKRSICMAAASGDWDLASSYDKTYPNWICAPLTSNGDTALHIAVAMEKTRFVAKLVKHTTNIEDLEIHNTDGNTAFCIAAISGNVKIAAILFGKNPKLLWIKGQNEMLPIHLASEAGELHMVKSLFEKAQEEMHINLPFADIVKLFFLTFTCSTYAIALSLLDKHPRLATTENEEGLIPLQVLAKSPFDKHANSYGDLLSLLFKAMEDEENKVLQSKKTTEAMFSAAKSGNSLILEYIFNYNPNLFMEINPEGQNLLHIAISNRQKSVFRLILRKGAYKKMLALHVDRKGNNILHLAGKLAAEERFEAPIQQFLIHSEELWFQEVEKIVPPIYKTMENKEQKTPKEVFYMEHKDLSEKAIIELNGIANNFLVVGTLLVSLGMSALLTIRTNNTSGNHPLFNEKTWYIIFHLSIGFGVSLCVVSMHCFTSVILPSSWSPSITYINSRLARMTFGIMFLYASIGALGIFCTISGTILIYNIFPNWVFYVTIAYCGLATAMMYVFLYRSILLSVRLTLSLSQQYGAIILSKLGFKISWEPFFMD